MAWFCPAVVDGGKLFFESLDYENEHFEGFCTFWTVSGFKVLL